VLGCAAALPGCVLGLLAVQAGLCPGHDVCGEAFPNIPRGDEAAGRPHARVGGPVVVFEYLLPKVSGQNVPVKESPMRSRSATFCMMMRRPGLERRACTCGQRTGGGPCPLDPGVLCQRWLRRLGWFRRRLPAGRIVRPLRRLTYLVHTQGGLCILI
jgi:hypothetical protein